MPNTGKDTSTIQGEGDYASAKKFDDEEAAFAKSGKVGPAAKAAKDALDGPESADLEAARTAAAKGESVKTGR